MKLAHLADIPKDIAEKQASGKVTTLCGKTFFREEVTITIISVLRSSKTRSLLHQVCAQCSDERRKRTAGASTVRLGVLETVQEEVATA